MKRAQFQCCWPLSLFAGVIAFVFMPMTSRAQTQVLMLNLQPAASITITNSTTTLTLSGGPFSNFTGTTSFSYKVRTTGTGGSGSVVVQFGGDLTSGANTIAIGNLSYTCTDVAPASGTACTSSVTAVKTPTAGTAVANFGAGASSAGTSGNSVNWTLANKPSYKSGTYGATATFTISAL